MKLFQIFIIFGNNPQLDINQVTYQLTADSLKRCRPSMYCVSMLIFRSQILTIDCMTNNQNILIPCFQMLIEIGIENQPFSITIFILSGRSLLVFGLGRFVSLVSARNLNVQARLALAQILFSQVQLSSGNLISNSSLVTCTYFISDHCKRIGFQPVSLLIVSL